MKVLVTGGSGLVGNGIKENCSGLEFVSSGDCDLTEFYATKCLFERILPTHVIHLAACVGGLFKNINHKIHILHNNLLINYRKNIFFINIYYIL